MKELLKIFSLLTVLGIAFTACEDPFDIDVEPGESQLVVDGFITTEAETQVIKLTKTVDFFKANTPPAASGAEVVLLDQNLNIWNFTENPTEPGSYEWEPSLAMPYPQSNIGQIGDTMSLFIVYENDTFISTSIVNRTTPVDSVVFIFEEDDAFTDEGFYAELKASDLPGEGDVYWIRTWVNGIYLSKAAEINVAFDASFTPNAVSDGIPFILPIRRGINPIDDDEDEVRDSNEDLLPKAPFSEGDSVYVEIWSINEATLFFLQQIQAEVNNGGLFATPPTNVRSNIFNLNPDDPTAAVGHFNISVVSSGGARL